MHSAGAAVAAPLCYVKSKIYIGETTGYSVTILPTNANDKELEWSWTPSGSSVASVYTASQQVTGRAQGTVTIIFAVE